MANNDRKQSIYADNGDPATYRSATDYKPGELGGRVTVSDKTFQKVKLDSGATSATPVGVVAAGQAAFWKNKATWTVTNDIRFAWGTDVAADYARNSIAGVFGVAAAAGEFCFIQQEGRVSLKAAAGGTWTQGGQVIANSGSAADFTTSTIGTAPTHKLAGFVRGARNGTTGLAAVDLQLPEVP